MAAAAEQISIEGRAAELGFRLPVSGEIIFFKTDMGDEGHMGGYTQKNEIYLSVDEAKYLARAFQADPEFDADYLEYLIHFGRYDLTLDTRYRV